MLFKRQQKKMVRLQETHFFCLHVFSNFPTWSAYYLCDSLLKTGCLGPRCSRTPSGQSDSSRTCEDLAVLLKMYNTRQLPVSTDCGQIHIFLLLMIPSFFPAVDTQEGQEEISEPSCSPLPPRTERSRRHQSLLHCLVTILQTASYLKKILRCSR